jgi:hypothetical protein
LDPLVSWAGVPTSIQSELIDPDEFYRDQVKERLWDEGLGNEAMRWAACHKDAIKKTCPGGDFEVILPYRCELRICGNCASRHYLRLLNHYKRLGYFLKQKAGARFWLLTLTLKYNALDRDQNMTERVDRILKAARRLFWAVWGRSGSWAGAIGCIEINTRTGYVHLHSLLYGYFVRPKVISAFWHAITGDSYVVYFQRIKGNVFYSIKEVLKYIAKVPQYSSPAMAVEILKAFKGHRRVFTVGSFYNLLGKLPPLVNMSYCPRCGLRLQTETVKDGMLDWRGTYDERAAVFEFFPADG